MARILEVKEKHIEMIPGAWFDYRLENGAMLHPKEWNGEYYTVRDTKGKLHNYKPVYNKGDVIAFEEVG